MGTMNKVCAFTGHRPNKLPWRYDETDSRCVALKEVLTEQIAVLVEAGFTHFLSGMAKATDTWSALAVLSLREKNPAIKLHCILPCTAQAEKWSASSQDLYRSILERADSVVYVSRDDHKNCMLDRNRFLVEHASTLLAVYNGVRRSGTGATVNYARKMGKEIIIIDPITQLITCGRSALWYFFQLPIIDNPLENDYLSRSGRTRPTNETCPSALF